MKGEMWEKVAEDLRGIGVSDKSAENCKTKKETWFYEVKRKVCFHHVLCHEAFHFVKLIYISKS